MKDYVILTDSCCDLSAGMAEDLELEVLPLSFLMEGKEYFNHLDYRDIAAKDFYSRVRGGALGTTSAINVAVFTEAMTELVGQGEGRALHRFLLGPVHHLSVRRHRRQ